ncbi:PTS transporter subunit EIIC [Lacrimispora algidixylanolytica]|uniref:PTS fructose transporter subunit IIB n=1 Tax=Lacrimispora algidixylanolytica TaxID=94868 RepID=A0A419T302_9FIRM|nr:PTS transporter subunit EIIC [Lacrimispora algidixylanolytica]RKD31907.1 PTS fructose transporter subunit IIB [Lacrimispora algidixylanolytica]
MARDEKFTKLAEEVLKEVGDKENIMNVTHCATRLRFNLKDETIPNDETLKGIKGVLGVIRAGGQLQVIIGQDVSKVYDEFCNVSGLQNNSVVNEADKPKGKTTIKSFLNGILDALSGSLVPAIPVITASAFFKMLAAILGPTMLNLISEQNDFYVLATFVGDAGFYFFPVIIGYTSAKKFKASPIMGILLGAIMLHPTFTGLVGKTFSVYGIPCSVQNYGSTILPIILSVWVMSYVERFFHKHLPSALRSVFAPAFTIGVMLPITLCVVGPAGSFLGNYIGNGIIAIGAVTGFLGVAIIGATFEFLVISGMHMILITFLFQIFATAGHENFVAVGMAAATYAVAGMCLGAALRIKNSEQKSLSFGFLISLLVGGITEPGLYGIGIRYKKPLLGLISGGFVGGLYMGILHVGHYTLIPSTNLVGLLAFTGNGVGNLVNGIIGCIISVIVSAVVTYYFGFDKNDPIVKGN